MRLKICESRVLILIYIYGATWEYSLHLRQGSAAVLWGESSAQVDVESSVVGAAAPALAWGRGNGKVVSWHRRVGEPCVGQEKEACPALPCAAVFVYLDVT